MLEEGVETVEPVTRKQLQLTSTISCERSTRTSVRWPWRIGTRGWSRCRHDPSARTSTPQRRPLRTDRRGPRSEGYEIDLRMMDESSVTPSLDGYDIFCHPRLQGAVYDKEVEARGSVVRWNSSPKRGVVPADLRYLFRRAGALSFSRGVVERSREPEIGWYEIEAVNGSRLSSGPWFEFHFDRCRLPDGAELWATSPRSIQAFRGGKEVGVQFHPEVDHVQLADWFAGGVEEARNFGVDTTRSWPKRGARRGRSRASGRARRPLSLAHRGVGGVGRRR